MDLKNVKKQLQAEIFSPSSERINVIVQLVDTDKKKKVPSYLCLVLRGEQNQCRVVKVQEERGEFKRKQDILLTDIITVNGTKPNDPTFDVTFRKTDTLTNASKLLYLDKLTAAEKPWQMFECRSVEEKNRLLHGLLKMSKRYLSTTQQISFINPPKMVNEEVAAAGDENPEESHEQQQELDVDVNQAELDDLQNIIRTSNILSIDAQQLVNQLNQDLNLLDGENVKSIMGSEDKMAQLMSMFDSAIEEIETLETKLAKYDSKLQTIRNHMEEMTTSEKQQKLISSNLNSLNQYLMDTLDKITLPAEQEVVLTTAFTASMRPDVTSIYRASRDLYDVWSAFQNLDENIKKIEGVSKEENRIETIKKQFTSQLSQRLQDIFTVTVRHGAVSVSHSSKEKEKLRLASHATYHQRMLAEGGALSKQLDLLNPNLFIEVVHKYGKVCKKVYETEFTDFFEKARLVLSNKVQGFPTAQDNPQGSVSNLALNMTDAATLGLAGGGTPKTSRKILGSIDLSDTGSHMNEFFKLIMRQVADVYQAEDEFLCAFFGFGSGNPVSHHADQLNNTDDEEKTSTLSSRDVSLDGAHQDTSAAAAEYRLREKRTTLKTLFSPLCDTLVQLIKESYLRHPANIIYMSKELMNAKQACLEELAVSPNMFVEDVIDTLISTTQQLLDDYFRAMQESIGEARLTRPKKLGTLVFVSDFQRFAQEIKPLIESCHDSEVYFSRLRSLLQTIIAKLESIPDDDKTPKEVIKLENYNTLKDFLSWYKVPALSELRKQASDNYKSNLELYLSSYVGSPIIALKMFLDEVQSRIDGGTKPEEIKFIHAFSTQELRKHLQATTPKEVEKGLKALYHRVAKHLSSDAAESMVAVVWGEMQRAFLENHKHHRALIHKCYGPAFDTAYSDRDIHDAFDKAVREP